MDSPGPSLSSRATDDFRSAIRRIEELWVEAGVEAPYQEALRSAFVLGGSPAARNNLPLGLLVALCCEAAGGEPQHAEWVTAAWRLLGEAAHLLDALEDGDGGIEPHPFNPAQSLNMATGLMTSASLALSLIQDPETALSISQDFYRTGLRMCAGQHADLTENEPTLDRCWRIVEAKSGAFFALACRAGARLAGNDSLQIESFSEFGRHLGILVQIGDDINGLWPSAGERSDLAAGKRSLPVAYAMQVFPASRRETLRGLLETAQGEQGAEAEARRLIIESGAVLYLYAEAERHRQEGRLALERGATPSPAQAALLMLLNRLASLIAA